MLRSSYQQPLLSRRHFSTIAYAAAIRRHAINQLPPFSSSAPLWFSLGMLPLRPSVISHIVIDAVIQCCRRLRYAIVTPRHFRHALARALPSWRLYHATRRHADEYAHAPTVPHN